MTVVLKLLQYKLVVYHNTLLLQTLIPMFHFTTVKEILYHYKHAPKQPAPQSHNINKETMVDLL